jgi:hypothetical protein
MFDSLISDVRRCNAEIDFELSRCEDVYRLQTILASHVSRLTNMLSDAEGMVKELEG